MTIMDFDQSKDMNKVVATNQASKANKENARATRTNRQSHPIATLISSPYVTENVPKNSDSRGETEYGKEELREQGQESQRPEPIEPCTQ